MAHTHTVGIRDDAHVLEVMGNTRIQALGVTGDTHAAGVVGNIHIHALEVTGDKHTRAHLNRLKFPLHGYPSLYHFVRY